MSRFPKFCITTDEDLRIETSCIPLKSVLRLKLVNFLLHIPLGGQDGVVQGNVSIFIVNIVEISCVDNTQCISIADYLANIVIASYLLRWLLGQVLLLW